MAEQFCEAKQAMCDPKNCNVEMCWWRDTVWALQQLSEWAYTTNIEPKPKPTVDTSSDS